jgi:pimeloyl-ACP methyl ester carboxylesterase
MSELHTHTLAVPGVDLVYDVREAEPDGGAPVLMMIGSPMDASGFAALADRFPDRTVVTYDPRGAGRSRRTDTGERSTAEDHADDLRRIISALDAGPVDIFASSGGAVNALALVARHPEQVRTLVAHEPPASHLLPDRDEATAAAEDIHETYMRHGYGRAMAKFIVLVSHKGPVPADFAETVNPNPAMFGLPTEDDGRRDDALLAHMTDAPYHPDFDALRAASTRIVIGGGAESEGELAHRAGLAVAERLGTDPVTFPGHHAGFVAGRLRRPRRPGRLRRQVARGSLKRRRPPRRERPSRSTPAWVVAT